MNINVVCPHCLKITSVEKKETYSKQDCVECEESLLEGKTLTANIVIVPNYVTNSDIPVIIDFWAPSCGPCVRLKPLVAKLALDLALKVQFLTVNTDSEQSMVSKHEIQKIPTLIAFKDGKEVGRVVGGINNKQLGKWVRGYID